MSTSRSKDQGRGGRSRPARPFASTSPVREKHLGLGWLLPAPSAAKPSIPPANSSVEGSSGGSISGSKRKTCEGCSQGVPLPPGSSFSPEPSIPSLGTDSGTPTPPTQEGEEGLSEPQAQGHGDGVVAAADIVALEDDEEEAEVPETGTTKRPKQRTSVVWKYFTMHKEIVEVNGKKYE